MNKYKIIIFIAIFMLIFAFKANCDGVVQNNYKSVSDLSGKRIGVQESTITSDCVKNNYPSISDFVNYKSIEDGILALKTGKIDAFCFDKPVMELFAARNSDLRILPELIQKEYLGLIFAKNNVLTDKFRTEIEKLEKNGKLDELKKIWLGTDDSLKVMPRQDWSGENGVIRYCCSADSEPIGYFSEKNEIIGLEPNLVFLVAKELKMHVAISFCEFSSLIDNVSSNKADVAGCGMSITENRKKNVDMVEFLESSPVFIVRNSNNEINNKRKYVDVSDFYDARIGGCAGVNTYDVIKKSYPKFNKKFIEFNGGVADGIIAIRGNKIDAFVEDYPIVAAAVAQNPDMAISPVRTVSEKYAIGLKKGSELTPKIQKIIDEFEADGTLSRLNNIWLGNNELLKVVPEQDWPQTNGILRVAMDDRCFPMGYVSNNKLAGYEVHLALLLGKALEMKIEFVMCNSDGRIASIQSSKADASLGCLSISEERRKMLDMIPFYDSSPVFLVKKADLLGESEDDYKVKESFWEGLKASINRTFIVEDRWKLIANGLGVTIFISVCSGILGSIIGFCLCMLRRTKNKFIDKLTFAFVRIIQGIPAVVFLMVLYYVVFGKVDVSPIAVSIIGFAINFGAYVSEMMRTGIEAVDAGQNEAALALGYSNIQSFFKVIFPQAAKHFLPVMKGEFIGMVKMTSIVGYIAGQDLTKATDIIRARTMEAFFPLIVTAIIYFIIANLMTTALTKIEIMVNPRK